MAFDRPTLGELVTRIREDFRSRLEITTAILRRSVVGIVAAVWAGATHMLHGHLDWAARQLFPQTADIEQLLTYARPYGLTRNAATFATGTATATGTNGTDIPEDTVIRREDGFTYRVTADATIASGEAELSLEATTAGEAGDYPAGGTLSFETPIAGVDTDVTAGEISGGNDEETVEAFRARLIQRLREPPQGGADHDYIAWALSVPGVTRAWVFPHEDGLGTVTVRFVRDDDPDFIPSAPEVAEVQAKLDEERPVTAEATAVAPVALSVDFELSITPDTADTQEAVELALQDLFLEDSAPGDGAGQGTILLSHIQVALGSAEGVTDFVLADPAADVVPTLGQIPKLGTVTFT